MVSPLSGCWRGCGFPASVGKNHAGSAPIDVGVFSVVSGVFNASAATVTAQSCGSICGRVPSGVNIAANQTCIRHQAPILA